MVAGHRPLAVGVRPVVEGRVQRVERERLPGAAGRGVVARVEDGLGAGRVADRAGDPVHADVVVPVGDEEDHGLALLRLAQLEVGGRLGGVAVEGLALVVGPDRALDQPPGLARGDVAADLDPVQLLGQGHVGAEERRERLPLLLAVERAPRRRPGLGHDHGDHHQRQHEGDRPASLRGRAKSALRRCRPTSSQITIGTSPSAAPRTSESTDQVGQHLPDPGLGPLGLAGDQRVAVDQRGGARRVGLAERDRDADPLAGRHPHVGQHRAGEQHHVAGQVGPDHRVVARQRGLAAAVQEDHGRAAKREQHPHDEVRRADEDTGAAGTLIRTLSRGPAPPRRGRPRRRPRR